MLLSVSCVIGAPAAQVAWCRYLISFRLELADKKVRPSGTDNSPPRDPSGFAAVLSGSSSLLGGAVAVPGSSGAAALCAFPEHTPDCKFAAYFARWGQECPCALTGLGSLEGLHWYRNVLVRGSEAEGLIVSGVRSFTCCYRNLQ